MTGAVDRTRPRPPKWTRTYRCGTVPDLDRLPLLGPSRNFSLDRHPRHIFSFSNTRPLGRSCHIITQQHGLVNRDPLPIGHYGRACGMSAIRDERVGATKHQCVPALWKSHLPSHGDVGVDGSSVSDGSPDCRKDGRSAKDDEKGGMMHPSSNALASC